MSTFACFRGRAFPGTPYSSPYMWQNWINQFGPKQGCCPLLAKFRKLYDNSFARALGGAFAAGTNTMALIQTCQIQAIMTVPQRLCFFAQLSNCNPATCWHIELSMLGLVHLSISIHLSTENKPWAGPGRSFCHGNEHHGIDPSIFSSGPSWLFHQRLSFSAQRANCNLSQILLLFLCSLGVWAKATRCCKQPELFRDTPPAPRQQA